MNLIHRRTNALAALAIAALAPLTLGACSQPQSPTIEPTLQHEAQDTPLVDAYLSAFNQHDASLMADLMHDDIEVYYVGNDGDAELGTSGKEAMEAELVGYFSQFPNVKSTAAAGVVVTGRYRSYTERVTWTREGKAQTQSSLAVLEFDGELLRRVWYYPAQASA